MMPALLTGVIKCSSKEHPEHTVKVCGSLFEVMQICRVLGLEPDSDDAARMEEIALRGEVPISDIRFRNDAGSVLFLSPVMSSSDMLASLAQGALPTTFD